MATRTGSPSLFKSGLRAPTATPAPRSESGGGSSSDLPTSSTRSGLGRGTAWPDCGARDLAVAADLAATDTAYKFGLRGEAFVAIADANFAGDVELSENGNGPWFPLIPGSAWPSAKLSGGKREGARGVWLRRRSAGGGKLTLAVYSSMEKADASKGIGGQGPGASTVTVGAFSANTANRGTVSRDPIVQAGAVNGQAVALNANTIDVEFYNRGNGELFVAETAEKATTAKGLLVPPGQSRDLRVKKGSTLYYATDATGTTFDVKESTE